MRAAKTGSLAIRHRHRWQWFRAFRALKSLATLAVGHCESRRECAAAVTRPPWHGHAAFDPGAVASGFDFPPPCLPCPTQNALIGGFSGGKMPSLDIGQGSS